ncbi:hypothetical protein B0H67DRAFT_78122 [Lasiosphaeris hirsuta]|uniref:Uncharacterized protein n=1 Tax=Lasiosphaeris hirsuta TaxID=260670 RepID=A0AA40BC28_9PEZI|nr:hypothetical protein B0H67DRAFT_78122 [Lasiosphaeris hirsuta]
MGVKMLCLAGSSDLAIFLADIEGEETEFSSRYWAGPGPSAHPIVARLIFARFSLVHRLDLSRRFDSERRGGCHRSCNHRLEAIHQTSLRPLPACPAVQPSLFQGQYQANRAWRGYTAVIGVFDRDAEMARGCSMTIASKPMALRKSTDSYSAGVSAGPEPSIKFGNTLARRKPRHTSRGVAAANISPHLSCILPMPTSTQPRSLTICF